MKSWVRHWCSTRDDALHYCDRRTDGNKNYNSIVRRRAGRTMPRGKSTKHWLQTEESATKQDVTEYLESGLSIFSACIIVLAVLGLLQSVIK